MDLHYGQVVERIIRRKGYSISELARLTNVNRRSVYNWFNQKHLKSEIIFRIGNVINHDFSTEFPSLYPKDELNKHNHFLNDENEQINSAFWKDKYIDLLEKYNQLLIDFMSNKD